MVYIDCNLFGQLYNQVTAQDTKVPLLMYSLVSVDFLLPDMQCCVL